MKLKITGDKSQSPEPDPNITDATVENMFNGADK
jgi:hypothetical protein